MKFELNIEIICKVAHNSAKEQNTLGEIFWSALVLVAVCRQGVANT